MKQIKEPHLLLKVRWGIIPLYTYRGCTIEKIIDGWKFNHIKYSTPEQVDSAIDSSLEVINKSILK